MKKVSVVILFLLLGCIKIVWADGPAAAPSAVGGFAAPGGAGGGGFAAPGGGGGFAAPGGGMLGGAAGALGGSGSTGGYPGSTPGSVQGTGGLFGTSGTLPANLPQGVDVGTLKALQGQLPANMRLPGASGTGAEQAGQQAGDTSGTKNTGDKTDATAEKDKGAKPTGEGKAQTVEVSPLEKMLSEDSQTADKPQPQSFTVGQITQFGYSFFRQDAGFAPQIDVPVSPEYIVGVGDKIQLILWGGIEGTYDLEVNRSGEVTLPKVGTVKIQGVPFGKLPQLIRVSLAKVYKDFQLNVNFGKLRLIKVYLVGEVKNPGDYDVLSLSTLISALSAAGGPTKNGSLRNIQIKRNGKLVETVDLYDFFLKGDKGKDLRLQSGDTIFVPTIGPVAGVSGNVRKPAIYELKGEKTLKDLLALADGINPGGYLQRIQISRIVANEKRIVKDFCLDSAKTGKSMDEMLAGIEVQDMDVVKIFPIDATLRGYVRLDGYVLRPGNYAFKPGMRIKDLVSQDNILPEYYQEVGEITRLTPPDYHPEKILFNPAKALSGDATANLELSEFDVVRMFSRWELEEVPRVRVTGDVQRSGDYRLFQNMTLRDLLVLAGNPKLTAYLKSAEITRIKITKEMVTTSAITVNLEEAMKGNPKDNIALQPFDEIYVRRIPNWAEETERYVTLKGEFQFPGIYVMYKGERLSSVIARAGGYTDKAYLKAAKFTRQTVRDLQQKRMSEAIARADQELMRKQADLTASAASAQEMDANKAALESLKRTVDMLKGTKAEGRMVIRLSKLDTFRGSSSDIELQGGDVIEVPQSPDAINVIGHVYNPTSLVPVEHGDVAYYLDNAGGPMREAETSDIYVVKADGSVVSRQQSSWLKGLFGAGFMSTPLESGDTVIVPQSFDKTALMRDIKDIATILGQLALTAGVMVAAGL